VTDEGDATTDKTITLTNTGDSLIASGKIKADSLSVNGEDITNGTITDNVQRIDNLETSNTYIWNLATKTEANVENLQNSNTLIWDLVLDTEANVENLQISNTLIWDLVLDTEANVENLQISNTLIWDLVFDTESNVKNLQTSNAIIWSNVQDLKSNTLIRTSGSIVSLNTGDILYAENADTLKTLPLGAVGTVLTATAGGLPSWGSIPGVQGFNNYYENGGNTGISNTQPATTLSVGSNLFVQDTGTDVLYVNGNVYVRKDITVLGTITTSFIRAQRSFVNRTTVVSERPVYTEEPIQITPN
jgi:predicted XRE-type DNA-binding protein